MQEVVELTKYKKYEPLNEDLNNKNKELSNKYSNL